MKISATLILLLIASFTFLKSQNSNSGGTKIDEAEKRRLENKFKSLKTFYISDDGLVVYQPKAQPTEPNGTNKQTEENTSATNNLSAPIFNTPVTSNNKTQISSDLVIPEAKNSLKSSSSVGVEDEKSGYNVSPVNRSTVFVKKPAIDPINSNKVATTNMATHEVGQTTNNNDPVANGNLNEDVIIISSNTAIPIAEIPAIIKDRESISIPVQKSPIEAKAIPLKEVKPETGKEITKAKESKTKNKNLKKGEIFKKKIESSYSSLEEAALASESILEKLQSQSKKNKSTGSISERIAIGAKKPLKKEALDPTLSQNILLSSSSNNTTENIVGSSDIINNQFGDEPTYYINGVQVDKSAVDKLKSKDVLRRQTRTRNIKSGNPNGEVWIDTY